MRKSVGFTEDVGFSCLEDLEQATEFSSISGLNLDYCGREACRAGHCFGPYVRENYVIHIVLKGKGRYQLTDNNFELESGQAFLIYPGDETIYQADRKEPWTYVWLGFHGYRAESFVKSMGFSRESPVISVKNIGQIADCMERLLSAKKLTMSDELVRMSQMLEIFALLMEENERHRETDTDCPGTVYVKYAMDYMRMHFREKVKIDTLAEMIGISRSYLSARFKEELQLSPKEYLIGLRMEHAAYLLHHTAEPIHIVATESGYEDSLSFSKAFKHKFGMSPKEYREIKPELVKNEEAGSYHRNCPL